MEQEKPKFRRGDIHTRRPINWSATKLDVPKPQSWYKPVNPAMKGVA